MRSNASLSALFLLLAGCVGTGGYSDFPSQTAAPSTGARDMAGDPYAREPEPAPYARPEPRREQPAPDPYASAPRLEDPYASPGASYERPGDSYSAPAEAMPQETVYSDPAANVPGPRGSSQRSGAEDRYDEVGYAGVRGVAGGEANGGAVVAVARAAPAGTFLEVTSLDTGKTIVVLVTGSMQGGDHPVDLSPSAARLLGGTGSTIPVRVRKINASPSDQAALRAGQPASERADTPPVLLAALRRHLPGGPAAASYNPAPQPSAPVRSATPTRSAAVPTRGGYYVQVGAFSNGANANTLARSLGGFVRPGGGLFRVQMGPYRSAGEAEAARANAAARGYGDARVFTQN